MVDRLAYSSYLREKMKRDKEPHTYTPPERFESHWQDDEKPDMFSSWRGLSVTWFTTVMIICVILGWLLAARVF